jgi:hypothetical protein
VTAPDPARVVHALASHADEDLPDPDCWPEIARHLQVLG